MVTAGSAHANNGRTRRNSVFSSLPSNSISLSFSRMIIVYSLQGEKGDNAAHPNAFYIKTASETQALSLKEISDNFPLSSIGTFHFRFRVAVEGPKGYMYIDITDPESEVPTFNGTIMMKVLRTDRFNHQGGSSHVTRSTKSIDSSSSPPSKGGSQKAKVPTKENASAPPAPVATPKVVTSDGDLTSFFSGGGGSPVQSSNSSSNHSNKPVGGTATSSPKSRASVDIDIDDDDDESERGDNTVPRELLKPYLIKLNKRDPKYAGKSDKIRDAMMRHDATVLYNADLAVQKKVDRDAAIIGEQGAKEDAESVVGPRLTAWAEDKGVKKSIRTLLATMHTVMWEGSGWKELGMGDLIQGARVTFHFKKAMLKVHPDKCMDQTPVNKLIAQRVFDALNQAYTTFEAGGCV